MLGITDMHCHILPGLDDGAQSMEETVQTLYAAARQGISAMITTTHFYPERFEPSPWQIFETLELVRTECRRHRIPITLYPGQECMYYSGLADRLLKGEVLTLAGSAYVLVEFDPMCSFSLLQSGLRDIRNAGYIPILAHFERYDCLYREHRLQQLKEQGYLLQLNFARLEERDGLFRKNYWRQLVKDGAVDYLGTDCHGMHYRPIQIERSLRWLEKEVPLEEQQRLLDTNIQRILSGRMKTEF